MTSWRSATEMRSSRRGACRVNSTPPSASHARDRRSEVSQVGDELQPRVAVLDAEERPQHLLVEHRDVQASDSWQAARLPRREQLPSAGGVHPDRARADVRPGGEAYVEVPTRAPPGAAGTATGPRTRRWNAWRKTWSCG